MGNRVTSEKPEDVGVVLFDAVFAVDEDEGSTESGLDTVGQKTNNLQLRVQKIWY